MYLNNLLVWSCAIDVIQHTNTRVIKYQDLEQKKMNFTIDHHS